MVKYIQQLPLTLAPTPTPNTTPTPTPYPRYMFRESLELAKRKFGGYIEEKRTLTLTLTLT